MVELCEDTMFFLDQETDSEMATAKTAADAVPNCRVILGDRSNAVTNARVSQYGWNPWDQRTTKDLEHVYRKSFQSQGNQ